MKDMSTWAKIAFGSGIIAIILVLTAFAGYLFTSQEERTVLAQAATVVACFGLFCGILGFDKKIKINEEQSEIGVKREETNVQDIDSAEESVTEKTAE